MNYKHLRIFLLLPLILFIECSTAETSNTKEKKKDKSPKSFIDTSALVTANNNTFNSTDNNAPKAKIQAKIKAGNFKQINFGFNIGYLAGLNNKDIYTKALTQIKKDGVTNLRVYEPFSRANARNPELIADALKPVSDAGFKILLCLSNYPFDSSGANNNPAAAGEFAKEANFTNRNAPSDLNKYGAVLTRILNKLKNEGIMQNLSFEIGNEPTAKKYFWGNGATFARIAKLTKTVLEKYNQPIYCCGFNTQFAVNSENFDKDYMNLINDQSFFDNNINLSFHFYPNEKYEFSDIKLPRTNNAIISEFNIFSYQKQGTENKIQYSNSAAFGKWMSELLEYTYNNNIKTVYLFNLMDDAKKEGALGFFDADGNPKQSYNYFLKLYNVIRDGYRVEESNNVVKIIGQKQTIVYSKSNAGFFNKKGRTMQNQGADENAWKIVNN